MNTTQLLDAAKKKASAHGIVTTNATTLTGLALALRLTEFPQPQRRAAELIRAWLQPEQPAQTSRETPPEEARARLAAIREQMRVT